MAITVEEFGKALIKQISDRSKGSYVLGSNLIGAIQMALVPEDPARRTIPGGFIAAPRAAKVMKAKSSRTARKKWLRSTKAGRVLRARNQSAIRRIGWKLISAVAAIAGAC